MKEIFEQLESEVRSYCRKFPVVFSKARNDLLFDTEGKRYIDFFAGAGAMNFGHNNPEIKKAILEYLAEDNIIHALDMYTEAKAVFLETFNEKVLLKGGYSYKIMFCGATGTNANEAALKIARKKTGRKNVVAFSGAFHGMTLGSLSITSDSFSRNGAGVPLNYSTFIPYGEEESLDYLEKMITDDHSGFEKPAAVFLETVQAEGGINVADPKWLKRLETLCHKNGILLAVDDIQVGVGRTGNFFSFERAGLKPDLVTLSKSISGFGLPMSILLIGPEVDVFKPAEHNGTWRGNQLAFIGAKSGIDYFYSHDIEGTVKKNEAFIREFMDNEIIPIDERIAVRGIGMIWGVDLSGFEEKMAEKTAAECFKRGLVIERAGRGDKVIKLMPTLTSEKENLKEGLEIIRDSIRSLL